MGRGDVSFFQRTVILVLAVDKKQKWCLSKCCSSSCISFGIQGKKWRGLFSFSGLPLGWGWLMKCCFVDFIFNFSKPTFRHPTWTGFGAKASTSFPAFSHSQGARWALLWRPKTNILLVYVPWRGGCVHGALLFNMLGESYVKCLRVGLKKLSSS